MYVSLKQLSSVFPSFFELTHFSLLFSLCWVHGPKHDNNTEQTLSETDVSVEFTSKVMLDSSKTWPLHLFRPAGAALTHLSDCCAEFTLKDFLQGLELVTGNVAGFLQLLQQLDGPRNIWWNEKRYLSRKKERKKNAFQRFNIAARESIGSVMEMDSVKARAIQSMDPLHWLSCVYDSKKTRRKKNWILFLLRETTGRRHNQWLI